MKIYVDLLLLINFIADFLLLWMTAFWRRRRVKWWRITLGSLIGTIYVLSLVLPSFALLFTWSGKLFLAGVMIFTTFGFKRFSLFLKDILTFYIVSFIFGGGLFAINFFFQTQHTVLSGLLEFPGSIVLPQGILVGLICGFILLFFLSKQYFQVIEVGKRQEQFVLSFKIVIGDQTIESKGLIDTGNQLYEPITRIPVIIMEVKELASMLPHTLITLIMQDETFLSNPNSFNHVPSEWQNRLRVIPYRGVGKGNRLLLAIQPDLIEIRDGQRTYRSSRVRIGLTTESLAADASYFAILHPALIYPRAESNQENEEVHYVDTIST